MSKQKGSSGIYQIRNSVNGKLYVGSAVNVDRRFREHRQRLDRKCHHSSKLQRAWNKYGADVFKFTVVECVPVADLICREQYWLDLTQSASDAGYNCCGTAGSNLGVKRTPETLAKMSAWQIGRKIGPMSPEHKQKIARTMVGKRKTTAWREALSAAHKGRPKSASHRAKLSLAATGFKHSAETKARISANLKGRIKSPEECKNISRAKTAMYAARRKRVSDLEISKSEVAPDGA